MFFGQVFYPSLNVNGKLFVGMDQNGVSPPAMQGQLSACTMERVKEESVSVRTAVSVGLNSLSPPLPSSPLPSSPILSSSPRLFSLGLFTLQALDFL